MLLSNLKFVATNQKERNFLKHVCELSLYWKENSHVLAQRIYTEYSYMFFSCSVFFRKACARSTVKKILKIKETNISVQNNMLVKHHQDTKIQRIILKQKDKSQE